MNMKLSDTDIIIDDKIISLKSLKGKRATYLPTKETVEIQNASSKDRIQVKFFYNNEYKSVKLSAEYRVSADQLTFKIEL